MLTTFALIGRANVGKSTLFNALTRSKDALVADYPGFTQDRRYGVGHWNNRPYAVIDTAGIVLEGNKRLHFPEQTLCAIEDADAILYVVDAGGITPLDEYIAEQLRKQSVTVYLLLNQADKLSAPLITNEAYALGFNTLPLISAKYRRGLGTLLTTLFEQLNPLALEESIEDNDEPSATPRLVIIGQPNVGKSTLINRLLKEERVTVSDVAGTTRDSIEIPFHHRNQAYLLVDTAGIRRRYRKAKDITGTMEKLSVAQTLKSVDHADVVILLVNAQSGISDQDLRLLGWIIKLGKPIVLGVNQWDGLDNQARQQVKNDLDRRLNFATFIDIHFISALHGTGIYQLLRSAWQIHCALQQPLNTSKLTRILEIASKEHAPPSIQHRRIKLRLAYVSEHSPLTITLQGKQVEQLPATYQRYLANSFRKQLKLNGIPIHFSLKNDNNPYV